MGRPRKIVESDQPEETPEETQSSELPLVMSIADLMKLSERERQAFRHAGGTSTEN